MPNELPESAPRKAPPRIGPSLKVGSSPSASPSPAMAAPTPPPAPPKPEELPAYEFLGYLPESYGSKKLFLVARDPHILFAYWDLTPLQYAEASSLAYQGKIFLEVHVPGEGRVQQLHVWDSHKNWYLQVNRPDTKFFAQLGYYRQDGSFEVLARSAEVETPRDTLSPNTEARFVTLPFSIPFHKLYEVIASQGQPGEELIETFTRLQTTNYELPFQAPVPRELTPKESEDLIEYLGDEEVRRQMVGSLEITEILKKRYEAALSSGQWTSSPGVGPGPWTTGVSSPFGASFGKDRGFHMHLNAEIIIYGGTTPDAKVRIDGKDIALSQDGTFAYHFVFPDGKFHVPVDATSADGVETRTALLSFLRMTQIDGDVRKTAQPKMDEPIGRT